MVRTWKLPPQGARVRQGTKIPQAKQWGQKKKRRKKKIILFYRIVTRDQRSDMESALCTSAKNG